MAAVWVEIDLCTSAVEGVGVGGEVRGAGEGDLPGLPDPRSPKLIKFAIVWPVLGLGFGKREELEFRGVCKTLVAGYGD